MTIEQRLEKLERQNKWMRRIGAVAVALVAAVFLMGQGKEKEPPDLIVKSLTVVDKDGKVRARLEVGPSVPLEVGQPQLTLFDQNGQRRMRLDHGITVTDQTGNLRALLNGSGITFLDPEGKSTKNVLHVLRVALSVLNDGTTALRLMDNGKLRASLGLLKDGTPYLKLLNAKGDVIWKAPKEK